MKNAVTLLFFILFASKICFGQSSIQKINGKITVNSVATAGITITNSTSKINQISDTAGHFTISIAEGDILIFSAINLETLRKKITKQDLNLPILTVEMTSKNILLNEVVVKKEILTAESLGIISSNVKHYTPAERKLYTATTSPGGMGLDPILNKISGRTTMLKKELEVENKEGYLAKMEYLFEDIYYTQTLKIPQEYIKGFQYYCVEENQFTPFLKMNNRTTIEFLLAELAVKYKKIISNEN